MAMETRTVLSSLARTLWRAATARGLDVDAVARELNLDRALIDDVDGRIPYAALMQLSEALAEGSQDPFFGLHVAEAFVEAATFGVVGFAARSCATLGEAIERTVRYSAVMNENTEIRLERFSNVVVITDGPIAPLTWPRHYAEMAIASFMVLSRKWTGRDIAATRARFQHPRPLDVSEHERIFACPLQFDEPQNQLILPADILSLPLPSADVELSAFLDKQAGAIAKELGPSSDWVGKLRSSLLSALPGGSPTVVEAARSVAMSARTLQRRLAEEGLSYEKLLDQVRRHAALAAIGTKGTSVQDAAFMAGYVDMKAFRRAFRRWTGESPQTYRRTQRGG